MIQVFGSPASGGTRKVLAVADLCYMPCFEYLQATPLNEQLAQYPNIAAWWGRLRERDSWLKVMGRD